MLRGHESDERQISSLFRLANIAAVLVILLGIGLRLLDLKEPPLDYHPTRQLRAALITRGIYYQLLPSADPATRELAIDLKEGQWTGEPAIFETLVSLSYLIGGGERLWLSRLWGILFWLIGSLFFFKAARKLTNGSAALVTLAYFWILPFGVYASRSFQPDVLFIAALSLAVYTGLRWADERTLPRAVAVGVSSGLAILIKGQHAPIVAGLLLGLLVGRGNDLRHLWRDKQAWLVAAIALLMPAIYYFGPLGPDATGLFSEYGLSVIGALLEPSFYIRWAVFIDNLVYLGFALLGIAAIAFLPKIGRGVLDDPFLQKDSCSQLALLPDEAYADGIRRIETALEEADATGDTLVFPVDILFGMLVGRVQE